MVRQALACTSPSPSPTGIPAPHSYIITVLHFKLVPFSGQISIAVAMFYASEEPTDLAPHYAEQSTDLCHSSTLITVIDQETKRGFRIIINPAAAVRCHL